MYPIKKDQRRVFKVRGGGLKAVRVAVLLLLASPLLALVSVGCSRGPSCGPGSVERDGKCVLALQCGPGTVKEGNHCVTPEYACVPSCVVAQCGDDGCGGSCGACQEAAPFCKDGACVAECEPQCEGRACGADGCGGECGSCQEGAQCALASGECVPSGWTCSPDNYDTQGACDCDCGVPDPDCEDDRATVRGCDFVLATCSAAGECVGGFDPARWTCAKLALADGNSCDCGCGIPDPDCLDASAPVNGCEDGQRCDAQGACQACVPECAGRACGADGCGGQCGQCDDAGAPFCDGLGRCVAQCEPQCEGKNCGADGCGGQCGPVCGEGLRCVVGTCGPLPTSLSCQGLCGELNPVSGCSCEPGCLLLGTCCGDVQRLCGCQPICQGRVCGDDRCGGECGQCAAGLSCEEDGASCRDDLCDPDPCNGRGACVPETGKCVCPEGFAGDRCDVCDSGYVGYPSCVISQCNILSCNLHGACAPADGSCACYDGFAGSRCDQCAPNHGVYPSCTP